ncbi:manganese efflux pump MntP family protein [Cloacibacillus sp. An23]|uniref:manganese efflux pump MntP n=1 Tax=Cloacibacillus sp. An23 TaxID=1965591 RepID=UPI000B3A028F|nr:manganese efflux pump MntP family protein [Cloacibacillus sp. An23]OUO94262.1 hypothetical protein B5F39_03305 [Cloacibacillus sp. An23]
MLAEFIATAATGASLAMDAFSVSICIGLCHDRISAKNVLTVGGAFGLFQFFMPLAGGVIAGRLSGFFNSWTPWLAAALIVWVAVNMIREAGKEGEDCSMTITLKSMTVLSFATSLDALAVGFSIESTGGSAMSLAVLAGIITFALSATGTLVGKKLGSRFGRKAEYAGGAVLLAIAARIIWQSL